MPDIGSGSAQWWITRRNACIACRPPSIWIPGMPPAKRGLLLLGAIPPDDSVPPFPVDRPRRWEEHLTIARAPREQLTGWANPLTRVFIILELPCWCLAWYWAVSYCCPGTPNQPFPLFPPIVQPPPARPLPTPRCLPACVPQRRLSWANALWMFLDKTYTPTPLYVLTCIPSPIGAPLRPACVSWLEMIPRSALALFQQAEGLEPTAPDITYYIGEVYRCREFLRGPG